MSELSVQGDGRVRFAQQADVDLFVQTLERYERGELTPDQWRSFRLLNGVYGQRQEGRQMLRVKLPLGIASSDQLRTLARMAETYTDGRAHVTTRQNFQFYGLKLDDAPAAMTMCAEAGITTREACGHSVRNVTSNPLAGVDPSEPFDVTPFAEALVRHFLRGPLSSSLPRKFKIAFEGSTRDAMRGPIHDIAFFARVEGGKLGFRVLVAGGTSTLPRSAQPLVEFVEAGEILGLSDAVVRVFHRFGERGNKHKARMKWLVKSLGWEEFQRRVLDEWAAVKAEGAAALPFDPQSPPVAPVVSGAREEIAPREGFAVWRRTNVIAQKQSGLFAAVISVPLGDLTPDQLRALAALAERFSDGTIRTTIDQNLVLRHVHGVSLASLHAELTLLGLARSGAGSFADVTTCAGAHTCAIAVTASRGMAELLNAHLAGHASARGEAQGFDDASIKVSGCPNGCGQHHIASIGLQGGMRKLGGRALPLYQLTVGGGTVADAQGAPAGSRFGRLVGKYPARRVPAVIDRLLGLWEGERQAGERLDDFLARAPIDNVRKALADLAEIDEATATELDWVDPGQSGPFVVSEGEAECAA
jgi:sulfite reductase (NADPH) hemoprotein beta-component